MELAASSCDGVVGVALSVDGVLVLFVVIEFICVGVVIVGAVVALVVGEDRLKYAR
jgi:hypothetical protein